MEMELVSESVCLSPGVTPRNGFSCPYTLSLTSAVFTFVCVGLRVMASCVFSGMEDSYTVTCGMPLPCLADTQRNNSGLSCVGEYLASPLSICP